MGKLQKTYATKLSDIESKWHLIDASEKILGRMATEVAGLLMGKHKVIYARHLNTGDYVVVSNSSKVRVTGKKMRDKIYYRHSGYPGGIKETSLSEMLEKDPNKVIEHAVKGMLPKNALGKSMLKRLKVYSDETRLPVAQLNSLGSGTTEEKKDLVEE